MLKGDMVKKKGERVFFGRRILRKFPGRGGLEAEAWTPGRIPKYGDRRRFFWVEEAWQARPGCGEITGQTRGRIGKSQGLLASCKKAF